MVDSNNTVNQNNILLQQWKNLSWFKIKHFIPAEWINKTIYVKFTLQNSSAMRDTVYFYHGNSFRSITLHKISPSGGLLKLTDESKEDGFQPVYFSANDKTSFIAELHVTKRKFNAFALEIVKKKYRPKYQQIIAYLQLQ